MFDFPLLHTKWLQTGLIFEDKGRPLILRPTSFHLREMKRMKVNIETAGLSVYENRMETPLDEGGTLIFRAPS